MIISDSGLTCWATLCI